MFKRMEKLNNKLERERKKGTPREELGPPEMAMDDDSESSGSSSSSSSGSSSSGGGGSSSSSSGKSDSKSKATKTEETKKRKRAKEDDIKKEDEDESDSDDGSDDDEDSDDSSDEETKVKKEEEEEEDDDTPVCSIEKALRDPIFIHPRAESKANFKHRSCYLCPIAVLKTERAITVHLAGNSHGRHLKRFQQYCEKKLKPEQKLHPSKGGLNARQVVLQLEAIMERKAEKQVKHRQLVRQAQKEKKGRRMAAKKEKKQAAKAEREAERKRNLELRDVPDENGKKRQITETGETIQQVTKRKAKRLAKLNRVMPTKEVRKAAKKERKALKLAARRQKAIERAKEGAAKNKAGARESNGNGGI